MLTFDATPVRARFIGGYHGIGLTGKLYDELFFKVSGRRDAIRLQFNECCPDAHGSTAASADFTKKHYPGDVVTLIRIGAGKYAGYRLTGY